ncbi:MAG: PAS domain S-box protein [Acidimicrobiia bacterium]
MDAGPPLHQTVAQTLAVLTEAAAALSGAGLDSALVLDTITDLIVEHVGDAALAYVIAPNGVDFVIEAGTSSNVGMHATVTSLQGRPPYRVDDDSLVARCARDRETMVIPRVDLRTLPLPDAYRYEYESSPVRSLVYVPLATETEVLGVLAVARNLDTGEPFADADVEITCDLAELATRALANTRLHRELAASTALFETAFHSAPIGMALVSMTDDLGRLVQVNASLAEMTGYTETELLSMRVPDLFPPEARVRIEDDLHTASTGTPSDARALGRLVRRDGTQIEARVDARGVVVPGRPAHIGLMQVQMEAR